MTEAIPTKPRVLIVGLGLIGASFAKGLRLAQSAWVMGMDAQGGVAEQALDLGIIDEIVADCSHCPDFDAVILAVPVLAMEAVLTQLKPCLSVDTLISDVGSVKGSVVKAAEAALGELPPGFVPGHPIAGAERSGVTAAKADLFDRHLFILTPLPNSSEPAIRLLTRLWQSVGAEVVRMPVQRHDEVLAATSHLPHLLAFSLVDTLSRDSEHREIFRYAAGGFRDFTRIAASDPTMWHDVFLANRDATLTILDRFQQDLSQLARAIEQGDGDTLLAVFGRAKSARDYFTQILQSRQRISDDVRKNLIVAPAPKALGNWVQPPGDRSISHRAIILSALSDGLCMVRGFGEGDDNRTTLEALRKLGVTIEEDSSTQLRVQGVGLTGLKKPDSPIYLGNSGTSMRLLAGVLAAQGFDCELMGDASLSQRPMDRIQTPLQQMGAALDLSAKGTAPITIRAREHFKPLNYRLPMASAQVKSATLLAGLCAGVVVRLQEPVTSRDHTERLLDALGCSLARQGDEVRFEPSPTIPAFDIDIPGDFSIAAVHMAAATLVPGSQINLLQVGVNPTRLGFLDVLKDMGGRIALHHQRKVGGEPVADIQVRYAPLTASQVSAQLSGRTIDEFPLLFVLAAMAKGQSRFSGVRELRYKETDRLKTMLEGLTTLGTRIELDGDDVLVEGREGEPFNGGFLDCAGDHRVALAFLVAAQVASRPVIIRHAGRLLGAYPCFTEDAARLGYAVTIED